MSEVKKTQTNMKLDALTRHQLDTLAEKWNISKTKVIENAVATMYERETQNMNAEQKIRHALRKVNDPGVANAMRVFKGFAVDNGLTGWQCQYFGESTHIFLGTSVEEALDSIDNWNDA